MKNLSISTKPSSRGWPLTMDSMMTPKPDLELGVLVEVVEHHFGLFAALQFDHDAHAVAVAFVADIADAFDALLVDHRGHLLDELGLVDLVGDLADDDLLAVLAHLLGGRLGADLELAAAPGVGVYDALAAEDGAAGGEVRTLHDFEQRGKRRIGPADQVTVASMISVRLCGGMLVAMPTAIPEEPFTSRLGTRVGRTSGSTSLSS